MSMYAEEIDKLTVGTSYHISGKIMDDCETFEINFVIDNATKDIALHINPRLNKSCVVCNSRKHLRWDGVEERTSAVLFDLSPGEIFDILVVVTEDCYLISINEQHFAEFHHRLPYEMVRSLEVRGHVENVKVNRSYFDGYPRQRDAAAFIDSRSTEVPFSCNLNKNERLCEGDSFYFTGKIAKKCQRFDINFSLNNNTDDIALHISVRFREKSIVRNTQLCQMWGREERSAPFPFPFSLDDIFDIQVLVTEDCYLISINESHYASFAHRLSMKLVKQIEILGQVDKVGIERTRVEGYPKHLEVAEPAQVDESLSADDAVVISEDVKDIRVEKVVTHPIGNLNEGDKITIETKLSLHYTNLEITLKCADANEYCSLPLLLLRGEKIEYKVLVKNDCYMITINDNHLAKCMQHFPYQNVRFVEIKGDFKEIQVNHTKKLNLLLPATYTRTSTSHYVNKLMKFDCFTFCGRLATNCQRFEINFHDKCRENIALFVCPQLVAKCLERNSKLDDIWNKRECASALPLLLNQGDKFDIKVLVAEDAYLISINDQHFAEYAHRMPYENIQIIEIKGNIENVKIYHTQELDYPKQLPESVVSIDKYAETISMCYVAYDITELKVGDSLVFSGKTAISCNKVEINFMCNNDARDIALHICARLQQEWIARNCRIASMWGPEERYSATPFVINHGDKFAIQVLVAKDTYLISVNGHYFAKFMHRIPYKLVHIFEVKGDVEKVQIHRSIDKEHSQSKSSAEVIDVALPMCYITEIGELKEGDRLSFTGKIAKNCRKFEINFVYNNSTRDVALHIEPRFLEKCVLRNSRLTKNWGSEECFSALPFLFKNGENFNIQVFITDEFYLISINGHHFTEFSHRLSYRDVRLLEVKGDVEDVQVYRTID